MADDGGLATRIITVGGPSAPAVAGAQAYVPARAVQSSRVPQQGPIHDLFAVLRTLEAARTDLPRVGRALRPAHESVRLGQEPSLAFAGGAVASVADHDEADARKANGTASSKIARVLVHCFGMLGPNGPLPL